jgi:beta-carotene 15,15'-dioxygenase
MATTQRARPLAGRSRMTHTTAASLPDAPADQASSAIARYTWCVGSVTLCVTGVLLALGSPSSGVQAFVMLIVVALIGLPHGAYDLEVAKRLFRDRLRGAWWLWFGAAYLVLAALAASLWMLMPWAGLVLLLVGGSLHWGADDLEAHASSRSQRLWFAASRGAIPVAAPMAFAPVAVAEIFSALVGGGPVEPETVGLAGALWLAAAGPGLVASALRTRHDAPRAATRAMLEPMVLLAWFAVAPPVLAFTLYFCFWHAVRHSIRSAAAAAPDGASLRAASAAYLQAVTPPTLATWALGVAVWFVWRPEALEPSTIWQTVFIGLFALTVPHVTLEWFESRSRA